MDMEEKRNGGLKACVLASGSKGNSIHVSDGETSVLIDAGLSGKEIVRRMNSRGLDPEKLDGILVSHEHSDHIRGVGVLSRRFRLPVHINGATGKSASSRLGRLHDSVRFDNGTGFMINKLVIHPFSTSHDASDSSGFTIKRNGTKIGVATDLGIATAMVKHHLKDCNLLIVEANHDPGMLISGPYPWHLKQRIKGRTGHLSNRDSKELLKELMNGRLSHIVLAHLSETNNTPDKALGEVGLAMNRNGVKLTAALQDKCGEIINV